MLFAVWSSLTGGMERVAMAASVWGNAIAPLQYYLPIWMQVPLGFLGILALILVLASIRPEKENDDEQL